MGKVYDFNTIERWAIDTSRRTTFQDYLDDLTADDTEADLDDEIDHAATQKEFLALIASYGYTLDNAIPGTFIELLRKSF